MLNFLTHGIFFPCNFLSQYFCTKIDILVHLKYLHFDLILPMFEEKMCICIYNFYLYFTNIFFKSVMTHFEILFFFMIFHFRELEFSLKNATHPLITGPLKAIIFILNRATLFIFNRTIIFKNKIFCGRFLFEISLV